MIRLREIELRNFKNTRYGKIKLEDLESGASIVGLYGQNGSGKTSVVDAMSCLRTLLMGDALPESIIDCIAAGESSFSASFVFDVGAEFFESISIEDMSDQAFFAQIILHGCMVWYSFEVGVRSDGSGPVLLDESLSVSTEGFGKRLVTRIKVVDPDDSVGPSSAVGFDAFKQGLLFEAPQDTVSFSCEPLGKWRSLLNFSSDAAAQIRAAQHRAHDEGTSYVFSETFARALMRMFDELTEERLSNIAKSTSQAFSEVAIPLFLVVPLLSRFSRNDIHLSTTHRGGMISLYLLHIDEIARPDDEAGQRHIALTTDRPFTIKPDALDELERTLDAMNVSIDSLVPGLSLVVKRQEAIVDDDGGDAVRAELLSDRGGVRIPFRCESEGIQKLVSVLSMLVSAYNDENACVVIDELDSGVFEFLLGEILEAIAEGGKGQLIFTAHNLRALETLPSEAVLFTTVNPENRYIRFRGVRPSNNLRDKYLRSINLGGQKEHVYDPTDTLRIRSAFYDAGHPIDSSDDFSSFVESLRGSDGK